MQNEEAVKQDTPIAEGDRGTPCAHLSHLIPTLEI